MVNKAKQSKNPYKKKKSAKFSDVDCLDDLMLKEKG
jgi:hypothetical protein